MSPQSPRTALRALPALAPERPQTAFCGHCGQPPNEVGTDGKPARVCTRCHMGLVLYADAELAPAAADPFLVIDRSLTICAVSRHAEHLLDVAETQAVNHHISEFVVPADAGDDGQGLIPLILAAVGGEAPMCDVVIRPANEFGVRLWARIGSCGPPSAALLVLADGRD